MGGRQVKRLLVYLPFVVLAALGITRSLTGPAVGLLPLMALAPSLAALTAWQLPPLRHQRAVYVAAAGVAAVAAAILSDYAQEGPESREIATLIAVVLITLVSAAITCHQQRTDVALAHTKAVADMAQDVILRPLPHRIGRLSLAARYVSADPYAHVGGDFYEVVSAPGRLRLVIGDVQGKGLPAVQIMALALGMFREAAHWEPDLESVVTRLDRRLAQEMAPEQFVTAVVAEINPAAGTAKFICCGHPPPFIILPGTAALYPAAPGLPLGTGLGRAGGKPMRTAFKPGYTLLFYTDGISEARDAAGEFFPLLDRVSLHAPEDLVAGLAAEVAEHANGSARDDMALLAVRYEELP